MVFSFLFVSCMNLLLWNNQVTAFHPHQFNVRPGRSIMTAMAASSFKEDAQGEKYGGSASTVGISRRQTIGAATSGIAATMLGPLLPAYAAEDDNNEVKFGATWSAVDGLNSLDDNSQFVAFDYNAYKAMRDDPTRTPLFRKAIINRLGDDPESKVVVDMGTGPFALFALIAAQEGAGKVYAIEANPRAAASARAFVKKAGFDDVITIVEGFSTNIELPEKADFCIAEIVGSIASEEGAYATVRDAHRFLREPLKETSWIPQRMQTYAAPASYTLHNLFGPPEFDWSKLKGEPVRFSCRDKGLELLSDPQLVEDVSFASILQDPKPSKKEYSFVIDPNRIEDNTLDFFEEFRRDKKSSDEMSRSLATQTSHSFTGIALWPRLFLDDSIIIDSRRYGDGGRQQSHWQTVLPIMSGRPIGNLKGGETVQISCDFDLPNDVTKPPVYSIQGVLQYT